MTTQVSQCQNVANVDFIEAKGGGGGGDKWRYNKCKAPVKSSPPTNQHPTLYFPDAQPTVSQH